VPIFVKIAQGDLSPRGKFLPKIRNFYTHNVEISESINDNKFRQNSLRGLPVLHCPAEVMRIDWL